MATLADDLIGSLLNAGGLVGNAFAQGRQNQLAEQQGQQLIQYRGMQMQAAQRAQQQAQQYQADVAAYSARPTPQALAALMAKYPEQADAIKKGYDVLDAPARESRLSHLFSLYNAADNGRADLASGQIDSIISAEKAAGLDTTDAEAMKAALSSGDAAAQKQALDQLKAFAQAHLAIADPKFAEQIGLGKQENHFSQFGSGGIFDQRTGSIVRQPDDKEQYKIIKNGDRSESIVRVGGEEGGDPASGGAGGSGGSGTPRSVRNNNPGNLRSGGFAKAQPGYKGVDNAGYAIFDSPENGAAAQAKLLQSRYIARGQNTVRSIIQGVGSPGSRKHGYAPRKADGGDNTDAQVDNYIGYVSKELGIAPDDTIPTERLPALATAMSRFESGATGKAGSTRVPGATGGGSGARVVYTSKPADPNGGMSDEEVNFYAERVAGGGDLPTLGMGKDAARIRQRILGKAADIAIDRGINGGQANLLKAQLKANTHSLQTLTNLRTQVEASERTASLNADQVLKLAPAGVGGNTPIFNRWIQAGRKNITGDPALSRFALALDTVANEYAKVMTTNTGTGGVTTDSAREQAHALLNRSDTLQQLQATIHQMKIDMANRKHALAVQDGILRGNISGAVPGASSGPPAGFRILGVRPKK